MRSDFFDLEDISNSDNASKSGVAYSSAGTATLESPIGTIKSYSTADGEYSVTFTPSIDCVADVIGINAKTFTKGVAFVAGEAYKYETGGLMLLIYA